MRGERPAERRGRWQGSGDEDDTEMFGAQWTADVSNNHVTSAGESAAVSQDLASVLPNSNEKHFSVCISFFSQSLLTGLPCKSPRRTGCIRLPGLHLIYTHHLHQ